MLYSEQLRLLEDESTPVTNTGDYSVTTLQDWVVARQETVNLTKEQFIYFYVKAVAETGSRGAVRIKQNAGYPIVTTGEVHAETVEREAVILKSASSYTFDFEISLFEKTTGGIKIDEIRIGLFRFSDVAGSSNLGTESVTDGTEETVIDKTFPLPAKRKLPFGYTNECNVLIHAVCSVASSRANQMQDSAATPTAGRSGWRIYIDDAIKPWAVREDDRQLSADELNYGEGSYGIYNHTDTVGTTVNVKIKAYNNQGSDKTHSVYLWIAACVWWLGSSYCEPITLETLPFQSTLYLVLEPLWADNTKYLYLGKLRFKSFGAGTDYYSTASGTGIVTWNYTFETCDPAGVQLLTFTTSVTQFGTAITHIAADMR